MGEGIETGSYLTIYALHCCALDFLLPLLVWGRRTILERTIPLFVGGLAVPDVVSIVHWRSRGRYTVGKLSLRPMTLGITME